MWWKNILTNKLHEEKRSRRFYNNGCAGDDAKVRYYFLITGEYRDLV